MSKIITCSIIIFCLATGLEGNAGTNPQGCYSDTRLIAEGSLVTGSGTIVLTKKGKVYEGIFQQLLSDSGDSGDQKILRNLKVDETKGSISFEVDVITDGGSTRIEKVTGRFRSNGLKLFWRSRGLNYGMENPFMRRKRCGK